MAQHQYLFSPLKIGPTTIKNRIIFGPHVTDHFTGNRVTERAVAYYEERAKGGVGMIVIGASPVDETNDYTPFAQLAMWSDEAAGGLSRIAKACHPYGTKVLIQLLHSGHHQLTEREPSLVAVAPSQIPAIEEPGFIPKELEKEEIEAIVEKFAAAALRAKKAGLDGVELHGAHGYLVWAFLTPLKNKRTDEYGGSLENRFRFFREIIERARERVGRDFIVGVRISNADMYPGGLETEEVAEIAKLIEATGKVDYINVSMGMYRSLQVVITSHYSGLQPGYQGEFTAKIKAAVKSIPVFLTGRINSPAVAESVISEGRVDGVIVIRELIAEPEFANKARTGREEEIRPCMACNQFCVAHIFQSLPVGCQVNPGAGHEVEIKFDNLSPAAQKKRVLIIGAGPGGLECARVAAERGHAVVVYDRAHVTGGAMNLFTALPGRSDPHDFTDWLERGARKSGVQFKLGQEVTENNLEKIVAEEKPEAVVIATGARAARDGRSSLTTEPLPGHDSPSVCTYEEVILGKASLGKKILIVDELGDRIAPGVAEMLTDQGKEVEIVTRWPAVAHFFATLWIELPWLYTMLDAKKIKCTPNMWPARIEGKRVTLFHVYTGRETEVEVDNVVLVTMKYSNTELYKALKAKRDGLEIHLIGDAKAPRFIGNAVLDGHLLAREL